MRRNKKGNKIFSLSFLLLPGWFDGGWLGSAMLKTTSFGTKYNDQRGSGHTARSRWELLSGQQSFWWRIWGKCRLGCLVISRVDDEDGWWGTLLHMMKMVGWVGWGVGQQMTLGSLLTTNLATHHYWECVCSSQLTSSTHHKYWEEIKISYGTPPILSAQKQGNVIENIPWCPPFSDAKFVNHYTYAVPWLSTHVKDMCWLCLNESPQRMRTQYAAECSECYLLKRLHSGVLLRSARCVQMGL